MTGSATLSSATDLKIARAILLYEQTGDGGQYLKKERQVIATIHNVNHGKGHPKLEEGQLLTMDALQEMIQGIWRQKLELIEPHILARSPSAMAWFVPASTRVMFFKTNDALLSKLSGSSFPQPAMVFMATTKGMLVWALEQDERPTPKTMLCRAPYYNVYSNGGVCLGSTLTPKVLDVSQTEKYTASFFQSAFTHASGNSKLLELKGSYGQFWQGLRGKKAFPVKALLSLKKSLKDVFNEVSRED